MTKTIADLAASLVAGHDGGPLIETVPEALIPADIKEVYALQDAVIALLGPVGGWKVAAGSGPEPICAPVPQNRYFTAGAMLDGAHHRFVLAEVEVALRLSADLPAGSSTADVEAAIGSIHPALEMIGSPFVDRDAQPRNLQLGDLQSNGAVVLGPELDAGIRADLASLNVTLNLNGKPAHSVEKGASWDATLEAVAWLSTHAAGRGMPLKAGNIIITGSRALAPTNGASAVDGVLGDWGRVASTI